MGRVLVAVRSILYAGREFKAGEVLPQDDPRMIEAWLQYGSAIEAVDEEDIPEDAVIEDEDPEAGESEAPAGTEPAAVPQPVVKGRTRKEKK